MLTRFHTIDINTEIHTQTHADTRNVDNGIGWICWLDYI